MTTEAAIQGIVLRVGTYRNGPLGSDARAGSQTRVARDFAMAVDAHRVAG